MPAPHYGDFPASHTAVCMVFDSFAAATGASSAASNFVAGDILIYKDGGTTQRSSSAGIVASTTFDSQTGLQMVTIDLSDNTDAGFYTAGHEYQVGVADITIDSQTVRFWLGSFSIERAGGALALAKGATGFAAIAGYLDTEIAAILAKTNLIPGTIDGKTLTQGWTLVMAALLGKASGLGTTTAVFRSVDDAKDRITATVDASGNRTAVTLDAT